MILKNNFDFDKSSWDFKSTNLEYEQRNNLLEPDDFGLDEQHGRLRALRWESSFYLKVEVGIKSLRLRNKVKKSLRAEALVAENELNLVLYIRNCFLFHMELYGKFVIFRKSLPY